MQIGSRHLLQEMDYEDSTKVLVMVFLVAHYLEITTQEKS